MRIVSSQAPHPYEHLGDPVPNWPCRCVCIAKQVESGVNRLLSVQDHLFTGSTQFKIGRRDLPHKSHHYVRSSVQGMLASRATCPLTYLHLSCAALCSKASSMLTRLMSHVASSPQELGMLCLESSHYFKDQCIDDIDEEY